MKLLTASEQVAAYLREELIRGKWTGKMPGEHRLVAELGVAHDTVKGALRHLEKEGLLINQGPGKQRLIVKPRSSYRNRKFKIIILLYEDQDAHQPFCRDIIAQLEAAGYSVEVAKRALISLGMKVSRISSFVGRTEADAWVVIAGSKDVLNWFAQQPIPAFALFGRCVGVPLPGTFPYKSDALRDLAQRLIDFGHRRIVMLVREERRSPVPGFLERLVLDIMIGNGIRTGPYNLPDWKDSREGLHEVLDELFRHTPPTSLIVDDSALFFPIMQHLSSLGYAAPETISLACMDRHSEFMWCQPEITHISWDTGPLVKRVVDWVRHASQGKADQQKRPVPARLVLGGTIGPVPVITDVRRRNL